MKPKHQYPLSQRGGWIYGAKSLKQRKLLYESMFILIERWALTLKMVERKVFLMKPKHQNHLSQWRDCVYDAQSWKERRLLSESIIVQIDEQTLILKMVEREVA